MSGHISSFTNKRIYEKADMRVLVCGGAGYIGSNMTAMLNAEGFEAVVYDNLSGGHRAAVGETELVEGDLADYELLVATLKK
jgi:UDP-glucose 4-epimerase